MRPVTCVGMGVRTTTITSPLRIAARLIITGGGILLRSDNPEFRSGDGLQILPIELVVAYGQLMLLRILIACDPNLLSPLAEGQQHLTINKVAHVDRTIRQVILHILDLMQEFAAIRFGDAWIPALVPGVLQVAQRFVARQLDRTGRVQSA